MRVKVTKKMPDYYFINNSKLCMRIFVHMSGFDTLYVRFCLFK
jgi:hypothetical protein